MGSMWEGLQYRGMLEAYIYKDFFVLRVNKVIWEYYLLITSSRDFAVEVHSIALVCVEYDVVQTMKFY
jgi:hypothetical protein